MPRRRRRRQSEPAAVTFFLDSALGRSQVASALRAVGEQVELHDQHFESGTLDIEWIPYVGERQWVVLTKDSRMGTNRLEQRAIHSALLVVFTLANGNMRGEEMAQAFVEARFRMRQTVEREQKPFVAKVYKDGTVRVWKSSDDLQGVVDALR